MTAKADPFATAYVSAFDVYLRDRDERALRAAYEVGRDAVGAGRSVLDLATIHHQALLEALRSNSGREAEEVATAAGEFFLESLSAFEMVQRGFRESREAAVAEKRQTAMLRQLSGFLADTSLALDGPGALEEVLHLVAEHAREFAGASWCLARVVLDEDSRPVLALASADPSSPPSADLETLYKLTEHDEPEDMADLGGKPSWIALARLFGLDRPFDGRLVAPLTALDGRPLGMIQLLDKRGGFSEVDEAMVLHLAQMAAAAVERARLYSEDPSSRLRA
jgi:hypothetical protein